MPDKNDKLRRRSTHVLFWTGVVLLVLIVLIILAPMLLSTRPGNRLLLNIVNDRIPGHFEAGHIHLDWFEGLAIQNLQLFDPKDDKVFQIHEVLGSRGLWHLIWNAGDWGSISLDYPNLQLKVDRKGRTNFDAALGLGRPHLQPTEAGFAKLSLDSPLTDELPRVDFGVHHGKVFVEQEGAAMASLSSIHAHVRHPSTGAKLNVELVADSELGSTKGHVNAVLTLKGVERTLEGKGTAEHLAVIVIDQLLTLGNPGWRGLLTQTIGSTISFNFASEGGLQKGALSLEAESSNLKAKLTATGEGGTLYLDDPAIFNLKLQPNALTHFLDELPLFENIQLQQPAHLQLVIEFLRAEPEFEPLRFRDLTFDANFTLKDLVAKTPWLGEVEIQDLRADLATTSATSPIVGELVVQGKQTRVEAEVNLAPFPEMIPTQFDLKAQNFPVALIGNTLELEGRPLLPLIGDSLSFELRYDDKHFALSASSPLLTIPLMRFTHHEEIVLDEPATLKYTLTKEVVKGLAEPAQATLGIESLRLPRPELPFQGYPWREIATTSHLSVENLAFTDIAGIGALHAKQMLLKIKTDHLDRGELLGDMLFILPDSTGILGAVAREGVPLEIQGQYLITPENEFTITEFVALLESRYLEGRLSAALQADGRLEITAPVLARVDIDPDWLVNIDPELAALIARPFSIDFEGIPEELNLRKFSFDNLKARGQIEVSPIEFTGPVDGRINWVVGKGTIDVPAQTFSAELSGETHLPNAPLGKLKAKLQIGQFRDLAKTTLSGDLVFDPLPSAALALVTGRSGIPRLFGPSLDMNLTFDFEGLSPPRGKLNADLKSQRLEMDAFVSLADTSTFDLKGTLGKEGTFSLVGEGKDLVGDNRAYTAKGDFKELPIELVAEMLPVDAMARAQIQALLGSTASASLAVDLDQGAGPLRLELNSSNTKFSFEGVIAPDQITLTAPLKASIQLTPEIGQLVLGQINPLLLTAIRSEAPITVHIEPDGFSLPRPYSEPKLQVGAAALDLGKLWARNRGGIRALIGLFKRSSLNQQQELLVWSTPLYFSIKDGVVDCKRMDTLIGSRLQVASWGTVNLPADKVRMTLAIPGYSLRKMLGVRDIPDTYYLILPVRGPAGDPGVDSKQATPAVAALLARQEGRAGQIIGGIVDLVSGNLLKQREVPPPTTQPFPWHDTPPN